MESYISRTKKSRELYERAKRVLPAGVTYGLRHFEPYPFYVAHASGSRVYDVDGNEYVDYWIGHGALLLGHNYPPIVEAVKQQLELGSHFGWCHEWEVRLADLAVELVPSAQMIRFTNSGTEASMYAVRLARAYTRRVKIGKFEGGWHGGYDGLHKAVSWPLDQPESAGLTEGAMRDVVTLPYNDLVGVKRAIKELDLACIVIEPVQGIAGFIPAEREFLKGLREICDETGALLVFDEVITGFRLAPGGAQEFYGVLPDVTILGKCLGGGGFPIGGLCGRADIMELIDHIKHPSKAERSFHGGTYTGNPVTMRSGCVALKEYGRGQFYPHINRLGEKVRRDLEDIVERSKMEAYVTGVGSMFALHFTREKPVDIRTANRTKDAELNRQYYEHLLSQGIIYMSPRLAHFLISAAHSDEEIENLVSSTEDFFKTTSA